ncbi:MAG: bifunctional response regulator/alkaline phosphatase family protein [Bacteroidota bacterium]|nr:bifunctional response regulator/alkaline phosphatase family protein [Bacteroidota bacterium]
MAEILWADDEIDLLKPHILFLENKGYTITQVKSGVDAIEACENKHFDVVFLDEHMPGLSGLEALVKIKEHSPQLPVVMITKSEEEMVMEDAIGSQIADYLIKPVNPNQILLSLKKLLENKRLVSEKVTMQYQQDFGQLSMRVNDKLNADEWIETFKKLTHWAIELEKSEAGGMKMVLDSQRNEASGNFNKFIQNNYLDWMNNKHVDVPVMSHNLMERKILPLLDNDGPLYFFLIDNLRYDQWKAIEGHLTDSYRVINEDLYYGILPTSTQYARNALFAGITPLEISKRFPSMWVNDEEEGGKNLHEEAFLRDFFTRRRMDMKISYHKITNLDAGRQLSDNINNLSQNKLNVIVYNFVDLLSHVRTEMTAIKELAEDEIAYRALTKTWFLHSPLADMLKKLAAKNANVFITTDHGSVLVRKPTKIIGDRNTTTNLRYKTGKNLNFSGKEVFEVNKPEDVGLPRQHVSSTFAFATEDYFFVYPNNYNYYVNYYKNTFQHGGASIDEMLIPAIYLKAK